MMICPRWAAMGIERRLGRVTWKAEWVATPGSWSLLLSSISTGERGILTGKRESLDLKKLEKVWSFRNKARQEMKIVLPFYQPELLISWASMPVLIVYIVSQTNSLDGLFAEMSSNNSFYPWSTLHSSRQEVKPIFLPCGLNWSYDLLGPKECNVVEVNILLISEPQPQEAGHPPLLFSWNASSSCREHGLASWRGWAAMWKRRSHLSQ